MISLAKRVRDASLLEGEFTLRSGRKSNYYLDIKKSYGDPSLLNDLVDGLHSIMDPSATCVVGIGFGGIPLASVMSSRHNLKLCNLRDDVKDYGTKKSMEAYEPTSKDRVIVPDDVFTTGSSLKRATEIIKLTDAKIIQYGVLVNREEGDPSELDAPLVWLLTLKQIIDAGA